jgi:hypothetical protein
LGETALGVTLLHLHCIVHTVSLYIAFTLLAHTHLDEQFQIAESDSRELLLSQGSSLDP